MNKSVLLLICNFLLLSMLTLAWLQTPQADDKAPAQMQLAAGDSSYAERDMIDALKSSLEQERLAAERLDNLLRETQASLESNRIALVEREQQVQQTDKKLTRREEEARQLVAAQGLLEEKLALSREELAKAQQQNRTNLQKIATLQRQQATTQATLEAVQRRYASAEAELESVQNRYKSSMQELEGLQKKLLLAETEMRVNEQLLEELEQDLRGRPQGGIHRPGAVEPVDSQKTAPPQNNQSKATIQESPAPPPGGPSAPPKPSEGPTAPAAPPPSPPVDTIFGDVTANRLHSTFLAARSGLFGKPIEKSVRVPTLLFSDGKQLFVAYHVRETPVEFTAVGTEWERVTVTLEQGKEVQLLTKLGFLDRDPRILIAPVADQQAAQLRGKAYRVAGEMFKVQDTVLVGARENYCGECSAQPDPDSPGYLRIQKERSGRVIGKFAPSRGDLVFARSGEVIGIMANSEYCLVFDQLKTARTIALGNKMPKQTTAAYLSQMHFQVEGFPSRLR